MSLVTCAKTGEALINWLNVAPQLKKDELCAALGCGGGMTDEEIAAIFLKCDGTVHLPGDTIPTCDEMDQAIEDAIDQIFTGGTAGQVWTKRADGTQGWETPTDTSFTLNTAASPTATLTGDGTAGAPLTAAAVVAPTAGNQLTATPTGLFTPAELPAGATVGQVLTADAAGAPEWTDPTDASFTLNTAASPTATLTGDGTAGAPLTAAAVVAPTAGNQLTATPTGLFTPAELPAGATVGQVLTADAAGAPVWTAPAAALTTAASPTATLTGDGTAGAPLTAAAVVAPTAGNQLTATPTGLFTPAELPAGATEGQVLTANAAGEPVWGAAPSGGGDVCESFDTLPLIPSPAGPFKVLIKDANDDCGYISMNNTNFYVDVRTETRASVTSAVENEESLVTFVARNVGSTAISGLRMVATIPAVTSGTPEFTQGTPVISNPASVPYTLEVNTATQKEILFGAMPPGATFSYSIPMTLLIQGTYVFATDLILPPDVIDYSLVDNHSTATVAVRTQQPVQPDPITCPAMDVTVSVDGGPLMVPTLREIIGTNNQLTGTNAISSPRSVAVIPVPAGSGIHTAVIRTQVPVTLAAYRLTSNNGTDGGLILNGATYTAGDARGYSPNPANQVATWATVTASPGNQEFTISVDAATMPAAGITAAIAVRPSETCIWQQFGIIFAAPRVTGTLTFTGSPPPLTKTLSPDSTVYSNVAMDGTVMQAGNPNNLIVQEIATLNITSGTGYSFTVTSTAPGALGFASTSGNIDIDVISANEWNVTISPLATAADSQTVGRLTFNIV